MFKVKPRVRTKIEFRVRNVYINRSAGPARAIVVIVTGEVARAIFVFVFFSFAKYHTVTVIGGEGGFSRAIDPFWRARDSVRRRRCRPDARVKSERESCVR